MPITETTPQLPINPYGRTKLIIEQVLSDYNRAYDLQSVTLRYFNAAGCDPDGELGERHHPETHAIPLAIRAALGTGPRFRIFGSDYPTPDGTAIRDYVHVSDLADAHVKAVDYLLRGNGSRIFNLATGRGTSVKELLTAVERVTGKVVPMEYLPRREGDPPQLFATSQTAKDSLEWSPQYLNIDETVATAARWFTSAWISN
jgi:UDP-arabinose 4-epimerase